MYRVERKEVCAILDEFYTFDLMERICRKIDLDFEFQCQNFFLFASYSTRYEGKTFPRNHKSQCNSFFEKKFFNNLTAT